MRNFTETDNHFHTRTLNNHFHKKDIIVKAKGDELYDLINLILKSAMNYQMICLSYL